MKNYDEDGFNPCDLDDDEFPTGGNPLDRHVPDSENYYSGKNGTYPHDVDLNFNNREYAPQDDYGYGRYSDPQPSAPYSQDDEWQYGTHDRRDAYDRARDTRSHDQRPRRTQPPQGGRRKKKKGAKAGGIFAAVIALVLVAAVALGAGVNSILGKIIYDEKAENTYVDAGDLVSTGSVKNILLLGVDKRSSDEEQTHTDTMMLISIDKQHKCIKMTSFLRDTWLYIPCHDGNQRLNTASIYGGYSDVQDTIEYNFGVKVDGYVVADFEMFKIIVDAIGGVEVDVTEKEAKEVTGHPKRYGNVTLEAGTHNLTGEQALAYCRIRKIDTDFVRTERQRTVISAIIQKLIKNPVKMISAAKDVAPYIETSLSKGEIISCAFSALPCLTNLMQEKVPMDGTWSYKTIRGASVISADIDENKRLLVDYIYNQAPSEDTTEAEEK